MPATWQFYPQKMVFPAMPVQTWESFAYLASRIKDWTIRRSSSKPEKTKIWAFSGNRSLVCLPATIGVLLMKGLTSTHMWKFSRLETNFTGKKIRIFRNVFIKARNCWVFESILQNNSYNIVNINWNCFSETTISIVCLLKTEVTGWTSV